MQLAQFDTRAFFMAAPEVLGVPGSGFTHDLERFAQRAEAAEKAQAGILALEALVVFGEAGRRIDTAGWNLLSAEIAACVRKGEDERAARLLVPHGAMAIVDTLSPTAESVRIVMDDIAIDSEAVAHSRCAAFVAALFRALSRHFANDPAGEDNLQHEPAPEADA
ncbi:hypothetical protein WBP06_12740 [Novosphingobium sp. BL-8H]|uniref:hypothetical protein n=1 Tax=Novosphingobium sp. BL-8H TaxID=3127640 RepID=UPI0037571BB0